MAIHLSKIIREKDWNRSSARHLVNRAGFGLNSDLVDQLEALGSRKAVNLMLAGQRGRDPVAEPDWMDETPFEDMRQAMKGLDEDERRKLRRQKQKAERKSMGQLKIWWLKRLLSAHHPLQEKMTHFWHGHFATSARKVKSSAQNYELNEIFRRYGMGDFRTLVIKVSQSPAMLRYLDNLQNKKGHPNENFARELMELFTVGIGNYSEKDIQESARAFTGWGVRRGEFYYNQRQHDEGEKTFLGQRGNLDGYDIIHILCQQKATNEFICRKLWEFFVYETPDEAVVQQLTMKFAQGGYVLGPLLKTMFNSKEFYSTRAVRKQIKSPAQLMVNLLDQLDIDLDQARTQFLSRAMGQMGQDLFYPPNVKGWPGNRAWINSNTLLARYNLSNTLLNGSFDGQTFFAPFENKTAQETIRLLSDRFHGMQMNGHQRKTLLAAIHPQARGDLVIPEAKKSQKHLTGVVHLILSSAEYQLC